jgi:branched-chain amino acid transport system substrate-binding protein
MKRIFLLSVIFLCFLACRKSDSVVEPVQNNIRLGAVLDLSGDYSQEGLTGKAAIELAIESLNARYASVGSPVRFSCVYADTHMDTNLTKSGVKEMYDAGIRLLVGGPGNSTELKAVKPFLDANRMLAITCFSSSPSLSVADDYIYRLITDDNVQAGALAAMVLHDSVRAVIPLFRDDTYGRGLVTAMVEQSRGKNFIVNPGISFKPGSTNYQELTARTAGLVAEAAAAYGASKVAVLLVTYQEASEFLSAAQGNEILGKARWYGCDANVQKESVLTNTGAAEFASAVRFIAPIMGIGTAGMIPAPAAELSDLIRAKTGYIPDAYALSAYDAVQICGLAYDIAGSADAGKIRTVVPSVCSAYNYLGISRKLNAAGDLATANYIFWRVRAEGLGFIWDSYATYMAEGNYIVIK